MRSSFQAFLRHFKGADGEYEQVVLRLTYNLLILIFLSERRFFSDSASVPLRVYDLSVVYTLASLILMLWVFHARKPSRERQWLGMVCDIGAISYGMANLQEAGYLLYGIYLWVIIGNGIRYGIPSLLSAYLMSLLGFGAVIFFNPFWSHQHELSTGLMVALLLLPVYLIKLLDQLNQALQYAREANLAKSQFLAHMSHEMRTPLNGVIGTTDLLTTTPLNGEQFELINTLKISAQTLLQLIENVLDFAKIESGKLVTEQVDFDLHQLAHRILEMFKSQARLKGLRLDTQFSPEVPFLLNGNALHLKQVLINLVGNSLKFTDTGSVTIRVKTVNIDGSKVILRFEVIDTGIGIVTESKASIFESFTQANQRISQEYGGTGLGTTISMRLVKIMGGIIGYESEIGVGTVFWFELPFRIQNTLVQDDQKDALDKVMLLTLGLFPSDKVSLAMTLKNWGVEFRHELSVRQLIGRLEKLPTNFDKDVVILCHCHNLEIDPLTFLQRFARLTTLASRLSFINIRHPGDLTGSTDYLEMGYCATLTYPIDRTLLFNALHAVISPQAQEGVISFRDHYQKSVKDKVGLSILLAEDNETNRKIIAKILEMGGHQVELAEDGEVALNRLETTLFDLIILDMNMPLINGLDVLRIHRATDRHKPPTPIIILTANATVEAVRDSQAAGADLYLSKPIDAMTLLEAVNRFSTGANQEALRLKNVGPSVVQDAGFGAIPLINELKLTNLDLLSENQADFLPVVIEGFIHETEKMLEAMVADLKVRDREAFLEIAHTLKGSSGNVGAEALHRVCDEIMSITEAEFSSEGKKRLDEATRIFKLTRAALQKYLARPASPLSRSRDPS